MTGRAGGGLLVSSGVLADPIQNICLLAARSNVQGAVAIARSQLPENHDMVFV